MAQGSHQNQSKTKGEKSTVKLFPEFVKDDLAQSWATAFNHVIHSKFESMQAPSLPGDHGGAIPFHVYLSLEVMKIMFDWSDEELLENFHFDLRVCYALGFESLAEMIVSPHKIRFIRRQLLKHLEQNDMSADESHPFESISIEEIEELRTQTELKNVDYWILVANLKKLEKLIESIRLLQSLYDDLPEKEKAWYHTIVKDFVQADPETIAARTKDSEIGQRLSRVLAVLYYLFVLFRDEEKIKRLATIADTEKAIRDHASMA